MDALHPGEVDHQSAIDGRAAGDAVAAATDRDLEVLP